MKYAPLIAGSALALTLSAVAVSASSDWDTDGDGVFSMNELLVAYPTMTEETFITIDTDGDGTVNGDELQAAVDGGIIPDQG